MVLKINKPILNFAGQPLAHWNQPSVKPGESLPDKYKELTYGDVIREVLAAPRKEAESGDDKLKRFSLGLRCVADEVDLTVEERALIKELVLEFNYTPVIYGRIHELFEEHKAGNK